MRIDEMALTKWIVKLQQKLIAKREWLMAIEIEDKASRKRI